MIKQLLYISTVSHVEPIKLDQILVTSRRNNQLVGLTGMLMFNGKRFLQILEGPKDAVNTTFDRIHRDPRHRAVVTLSKRVVDAPEFGNWSMAHVDGGSRDSDQIIAQIEAQITGVNPNIRAELMSFATRKAA